MFPFDPKVFWCFQGDQNGTLRRNGLLRAISEKNGEDYTPDVAVFKVFLFNRLYCILQINFLSQNIDWEIAIFVEDTKCDTKSSLNVIRHDIWQQL